MLKVEPAGKGVLMLGAWNILWDRKGYSIQSSYHTASLVRVKTTACMTLGHYI